MNIIKASARNQLITGIICLMVTGCASLPASSPDNIDQANSNNSLNQQISSNQQSTNSSQDQTGQTAESDIEGIERSWQTGPHASTFQVDQEGNNNNCAQCHAPLNWQPTMDTIPETCFTCKFELEDPPPYIPQENWEDIPCNVCHELDRRDEVQGEYAWLAIAAIDEYEEVSSTTELCQKCHVPADPREGHTAVVVSEVHQDQTCTDCHDAHETSAECRSCHDQINLTTVGHDEDHETIGCILCHDGSPLRAGFDEGSSEWYLADFELDPTAPINSSHNILLESNCSRCHFADNPWQLSIQQ